MLATFFEALGPLLKWLMLALWDIKDKTNEAVEVKRDPALYDGLAGCKRM